MKLYIISLRKSTDRRAHMLAQLQKLGITDYEFVDGIDATGKDYEARRRANMQNQKRIWQMIEKTNQPSVVLEDDAVFHDSFFHYLHQRYTAAHDMAHVYLLGYQIKGAPLWGNGPSWRWAQRGTKIEFNGAYAYIVNGAPAAKLLLSYGKNVPYHADLMMMRMANEGKLTLFFMNHPIVQHGGFPSTLKHEEADRPANLAPVNQPAPKADNGKLAKNNNEWQPTEILDKPKGKLRLFINWYNEKNETRAKELSECFIKTFSGGYFDEIVNLSQTPALKVTNIDYDRRPTFSDFFKEASKLSGPNDISVIANLDVYFDETILQAHTIAKNEVFALTRYDIEKGKPVFLNKADSQDVWIFRGKIKSKDTGFTMGIPGCDNAIAERLERVGYKVTNPSLTIKTYHLHESAIRNHQNPQGENTVKAIAKPYKFLPPVALEKTIPTVYHIGMFRVNEPQYYLRNMLSSFGNYIEHDWSVEIEKHGKEQFRKNVIDTCAKHKPAFVFMQLQTPDIIDVPTARAMRKHGCKVINWTGDVRQPLPDWYITLGKHIDLTLFTQMTDVKTAKAKGIKTDYLQITDDEEIYKPTGTKNHLGDIVFMGNHYPGMFPLTGLRQQLAERLKKEFGKKFALLGTGWNGLETGNLNFKQETEAATYRGCKIAVNCSHFDYERYSSNRLFRIMLSGAFCLSHHYKGIEKDFEVGTHLDTWHTIDELVEKCRYYLNNEAARNKITKAGHAHVLKNHSRFKRREELAGLIKKLKN